MLKMLKFARQLRQIRRGITIIVDRGCWSVVGLLVDRSDRRVGNRFKSERRGTRGAFQSFCWRLIVKVFD